MGFELGWLWTELSLANVSVLLAMSLKVSMLASISVDD